MALREAKLHSIHDQPIRRDTNRNAWFCYANRAVPTGKLRRVAVGSLRTTAGAGEGWARGRGFSRRWLGAAARRHSSRGGSWLAVGPCCRKGHWGSAATWRLIGTFQLTFAIWAKNDRERGRLQIE